MNSSQPMGPRDPRDPRRRSGSPSRNGPAPGSPSPERNPEMRQNGAGRPAGPDGLRRAPNRQNRQDRGPAPASGRPGDPRRNASRSAGIYGPEAGGDPRFRNDGRTSRGTDPAQPGYAPSRPGQRRPGPSENARNTRGAGSANRSGRTRKLSPAMEARQRVDEIERRQKKAAAKASRRRGLRAAGRFAVYVLCAVALLAAVTAGGILIALHNAPDKAVDTGSISFYYGGTKVRTASAVDVVEGEELYVCFNDLADYLGMKQSGTAKEMKFVLRTNPDQAHTSAGDGTEESVIFYTDEHRVVVNGQTEILDVPNILLGEEIWVSSEFLTEWMDNLSVIYKPNQRTVKVSRIIDEELRPGQQDHRLSADLLPAEEEHPARFPRGGRKRGLPHGVPQRGDRLRAEFPDRPRSV